MPIFSRMKKLRDSIEVFLTDRWHPYYCIIFAVFLLYAKSLAFRYVYFDDNELILNSRVFLSSLANIITAFASTPNTFESFYRPLLMATFVVDAHLGGFAPFIYHMTNVLLHAAAACLLFALFEELKIGRTRSLLLALVFAVHPVAAQAVAWIPGRNDPLLAIFVIASFIAFLRYFHGGRTVWLLAHLALLLAAFFAKESAVAVPPLCALFILLYTPRKQGNSSSFANLAVGWGTVFVAWYALRARAASFDPITAGEMVSSIVKSSPALLQYVGKMLFPFKPAVLPTIEDTGFAGGLVAVATLTVFFLLAPRKDNRMIIFGAVWMVLTLVTTMVLPNNRFMEHRAYLPVMGLLIAVGAGIGGFDGRPRLRLALQCAGVLLVAGFGVLTFAQMDRFMNRASFWKNAVLTSPSLTEAHNNLGAVYQNQYGRLDLAEEEYKKAIKLAPNYSAYFNYGTLRINQGRLTEAAALFETALVLPDRHKDPAPIYFNYAGLCYESGRFADAENLWKKTITADPGFYEAYRNLALLYGQQGKKPEDEQCRALIAARFGHGLTVARPSAERWVYALEDAGR